MSIAQFLTDDPNADDRIKFGRHLYGGRHLILSNPKALRRALAATSLPTGGGNEKFIETAEELGLDPRNDNVKADFLLSQVRSVSSFTLLILFTYMFHKRLEPLVFEDENVFYYILGRCGQAFVREEARREIVKLLGEIIETID